MQKPLVNLRGFIAKNGRSKCSMIIIITSDIKERKLQVSFFDKICYHVTNRAIPRLRKKFSSGPGDSHFFI